MQVVTDVLFKTALSFLEMLARCLVTQWDGEINYLHLTANQLSRQVKNTMRYLFSSSLTTEDVKVSFHFSTHFPAPSQLYQPQCILGVGGVCSAGRSEEAGDFVSKCGGHAQCACCPGWYRQTWQRQTMCFWACVCLIDLINSLEPRPVFWNQRWSKC